MQKRTTSARTTEDNCAVCKATGPILGAISIMQPWAWMVVNRHKTFENRERNIAASSGPGLYYVHASTTYKQEAWEQAMNSAKLRMHRMELELIPPPEEIERGCIIGVMHLGRWSSCSTTNLWSFGSGYPILWASHCEPVPCTGKLGVFSPGVPIPGICVHCGCTEADCRHCSAAQGAPCAWENDSRTWCTRCANAQEQAQAREMEVAA